MEKLAYIVIGGAIGVVLTVTFQHTYMPANMVGMVMQGSDPIVSNADMSQVKLEAMHQHPPLQAPQDTPVPSVRHLVFPDAMDGYNVQILTRNFEFSPANINRAPLNNEGHAHIYVNGVKYARVYGDWLHLPASALTLGENQIRVTLNANNHSEWSVGAIPISSTVRVVKPE